MPFTFSHPALVLPFGHRKFGLSLTGLITGSMVPDFEYYFRMRLGPTIGHETLGFFVFDIPMALLLAFVFHLLVRNSFIAHLPACLRKRFVTYIQFDWLDFARKNKLKILLSVVVGIVSHLFWDAFTHYDGLFVLLFPVLNQSVELLRFEVPIYSFLQVGSSVLGLWILYYFVAALPKEDQKSMLRSNAMLYWIILGVLSLLIFGLRFAIIPVFISFWDFFMAAMGSFLYAWAITSVLYKWVPALKLLEAKP